MSGGGEGAFFEGVEKRKPTTNPLGLLQSCLLEKHALDTYCIGYFYGSKTFVSLNKAINVKIVGRMNDKKVQ